MSEHADRVAMVSDLKALEARIQTRLTEQGVALEKRIAEQGAHVEERITQQREHFEKRITEEAAATRRHFDVVAEQMTTPIRILAEATAHHRTILDEHEQRLRSREEPGRA